VLAYVLETQALKLGVLARAADVEATAVFGIRIFVDRRAGGALRDQLRAGRPGSSATRTRKPACVSSPFASAACWRWIAAHPESTRSVAAK
jgi:hypothetical protein